MTFFIAILTSITVPVDTLYVMVLFLGSARCVAPDVPDAVVYGPVHIPPLLGRCANHLGPTPVGRYVTTAVVFSVFHIQARF